MSGEKLYFMNTTVFSIVEWQKGRPFLVSVKCVNLEN